MTINQKTKAEIEEIFDRLEDIIDTNNLDCEIEYQQFVMAIRRSADQKLPTYIYMEGSDAVSPKS